MANADNVKAQSDQDIRVIGGIELMGESWKIFVSKWKKLFWLLLFFPIVISLASLALGASVAGVGSVYYSDMSFSLKFILDALLILVSVALALAMIYFSIVVNAGSAFLVAQDISPKEALKKGMSVFWKYLLWSIVFGLILIVGFILFIIPGVIFLIIFSFSVFAITLEGLGPIDSLKRSSRLVKGFWWTIFARFLVLLVFVIILSIISNMFSEAAIDLYKTVDSPLYVVIPAMILGALVFAVAFVINFIGSSISLIYSYLLYSRMKDVKDGDEKAVDKMSALKKIGLGIILVLGAIVVIFGLIIGFIALIMTGGQIPAEIQNEIQQELQQNLSITNVTR